MSDKDLMGQITQLNSLQELQKISASIQARDKSSGLTEAVGLIGKTVNYTQQDGVTGSGLVTGVSMLKNEILLWIGETTIPLSAVSSVEAGGKNE
jgi:flagellar hook assembly protein FlgD